jgi:adenylate cyclase
MGQDELRTVAALRSHRHDVIDPKLAEHRGRLVNTAGDSVLAEFQSVLDAVRCAVEMQQALAARNTDVPDDQRIVFRIGINVGDVIFQDGEIYGDGVNIAARLEQIGVPGSVYVSNTVYEQAHGKLPYAFEDLGPREVKNIAEPVHTYRVRWEGEFADKPAVAHPTSSASASIDTRPTIAVLPFQNMSGDPEQEYFSDGLTEDLITDLAALPRLRVLARNTTFTYKGKAVSVPLVGKELGASHVVEGSVRKSGQRLRLTAQLISVATGTHVWAQRYDRDLSDVFAIQDEIVAAIVTELDVKLADGEQARVRRRSTQNAHAYDLFQQAVQFERTSFFADGHQQACRLLQQAVHLDPQFAEAFAILANSSFRLALYCDNEEYAQLIAQSNEAVQKAIALDPASGYAHYALAVLLCHQGDVERAEVECRQAAALAPESASVLVNVSSVQLQLGHPAAAMELYQRGIQLMPQPLAYFDIAGAVIYASLGRDEDTLRLARRATEAAPRNPLYRAIHALYLLKTRKLLAARVEMQAALDLGPAPALRNWFRHYYSWNVSERERVALGLRALGFPD